MAFRTIFILVFVLPSFVFSQLSVGSTTYDGVNQDQLPSYYTFNGFNGFRAPLDTRQNTAGLNYFIRMWIRPYNSFNVSGDKIPEVLFEIDKSLRCQLQYQNTIACLNPTQISQDNFTFLAKMNYTNRMWIHIAVGGSKTLNKGFIRTDYSDQLIKQANTSYLPLIQSSSPWYVYIGLTSTLSYGFSGDIREFLLTEEYINPSQVQQVKNSYISWSPTQIGYYRFQRGALNDNTKIGNLATTVAISQSQIPTWSYDNAPNDICYATFGNFAQLPLLDNLSTQLTSIGSRMKTTQTVFQYTVSMWIRTKPGIQTSSAYNENLYIFQLRGVFSLWFVSSQQMKIRIHAANVNYVQDTQSFNVPTDEWINIQFTLDQRFGYEVRVYNVYRRFMSYTSQSQSYNDQSPGQQLMLFNNFKGYLKSVVIYQTKKTLPIMTPSIKGQAITDDSLIVYYNMDQTNFKSANQLGSLASTTKGVYGSNVVLSGTVKLDYVEFEESLNFTDTTLYGQLNQTISFFDGISCNNTKNNLKLQGLTSNIAIQIKEIQSNLSEATIELWFRRQTPLSRQNFIIQLNSTNSSIQFLSIYQEINQISLICQVSSNLTDKKLVLDRIDQSSYTQWQHVACKFISQFEIVGLLNSKNSIEQVNALDLGENISIIIPKANYTLIIGNNKDLNKGQDDTAIREVRFWKIARTISEIKQYLYSQIDPTLQNNLIGYYRMNSGEVNITNFINQTVQSVSSTGLVPFKDDSPVLVCPLYTYPQQNITCFRNAYIKQTLKILAIYSNINQTETISWQITPLYSDQYREFTNMQNFSYNWQSNNKTLTDFIKNQTQPNTTNDTLFIPNDFISNMTINQTNDTQVNNLFQMYVQTNNYQRTFVNTAIAQYRLNMCRYLLDNQTQGPIINKAIYDVPGQNDILLYFSVKNLINCSMTTNETLFQNATLEIFPSRFNIQSDLIIYNETLQMFVLNITKTEQLKVPKYMYVDFVVGVQWSLNNKTLPESVLNLVYRVKFVEQGQPLIVPTKYYPLFGDNLVLNGSSSNYIFANGTQIQSIDSYNGFQYQWVCPLIFTGICQNQSNFKVLTIKPEDLISSNAATFQIYAFKLILTSQKDAYQDVNFEKTINITYIPRQIPYYTVNLSGKSKLYVLEDNQFILNISDYQNNHDQLTIEWVISPQINSTYQVFNGDKTLMTILKGGLNLTTSYNVKVTISYTLYTDIKLIKDLNITTGYGNLTLGELLISPSSGIADQTLFNFTINKFHSDYEPIKYDLYGNQFQNSEIFRITRSSLYSNTSYISLCSELYRIELRITDNIGNLITIAKNFSVTVSLDPVINNSNTTVTLDAATQKLLNVYSGIVNESLVIASYNYTTLLINLTVLDAKLTNLQQVSSITSSFIEDQQDDDTTYNKAVISNSLVTLRLLSNNTIQMNNTIATTMLDILQQIQLKSLALASSINKTDVSYNYLYTISSLAKYTYERLQLLTQGRRLLYQNSMNYNDFKNFQQSINYEKNNFQNNYCNSLSQYERQIQFNSESYTVIIEKYSSSSIIKSRSYNSSNQDVMIQLEVGQILNKTLTLDSGVQDVCVISSTFKLNPISGSSFAFQNIGIQKTALVQTLDNQGNQILSNNANITSNISQSPIIKITFAYDFNSTANKFLNNQTVCMHIQADQTDYTSQSWSDKGCETNYNATQKLIICKCQSLSNSYYGIITDTSRALVKEFEDLENQDDEEINLLDEWLIVMLAFLAIFLFVLPFVMICLDKCDFTRVRNSDYNLDKELIKKVAKKRFQPLEIVVYRQKQLDRYLQIRHLTNCSVFNVLSNDINPLFNIFSKFDIRLKRLLRLTLCCFQLFTLALVCLVFFKVSHDRNFFPDDIYSRSTLTPAIYLGLILSVILLPIPRFFISCLKTKFEIDSLYKRAKRTTSPKNQTTRALNPTQNPQTENNNEIKNGPNGVEVNDIKVDLEDEKEKIDYYRSVSRLRRAERYSKQKIKQASLNFLIGGDRIDNSKQTDEDQIKKSDDNLSNYPQKQIYQEDALEKIMDVVVKTDPKDLEQMRSSIISGQTRKQFDIHQRINISSNNTCCKVLAVLICALYCSGIIIALIIISFKLPSSYQYQIMITFFTALLVGWFILNPLRIAIVSMVIQKIVIKRKKGIQKQNCCLKLVECLIVSKEAQSIVKDMLIVKEYQGMKLDQNYQQNQQEVTQKNNQFEKTSRSKEESRTKQKDFKIESQNDTSKSQPNNLKISDLQPLPASPPSRRFKNLPETASGTQKNILNLRNTNSIKYEATDEEMLQYSPDGRQIQTPSKFMAKEFHEISSIEQINYSQFNGVNQTKTKTSIPNVLQVLTPKRKNDIRYKASNQSNIKIDDSSNESSQSSMHTPEQMTVQTKKLFKSNSQMSRAYIKNKQSIDIREDPDSLAVSFENRIDDDLNNL